MPSHAVSPAESGTGRTRLTNVSVVALALLLVASIMTQSGRIAESQGYGFDGALYARMMVNSLDEGTDNQRMRPLVLLTNQLAYDFVFKEPLLTFQAMNVVYTALLALVLCAILDVYGASAADKAIFVANVFATIAIAKMFAFYPVLIDPGAYFWVALAVYAVVRGGRPLIIVSTVLAVFAREFGLVALAFGVHRDLRRRVRLPVVAGTYLPALVSFIGLRQWVFVTSRTPELSGNQRGLSGIGDFLENLAYLVDPRFILLFAYFVVTVFGGISLLLVIRALRGQLSLRRETEWLTYLAGVAALSAMLTLDIWRFLAYSVPAVAALYAMTSSRSDWPMVAPWTVAVTLFTQQPWTTMNDGSYFRDWFPLYVARLSIPEAPSAVFWAAWAIRLSGVACLGALMWVAQSHGTLRQAVQKTPTQATM